TWKTNASIDGISREISKSRIDIDEYDANEQKIYLIYSRGTHIYHDPKVGIEGIYIIDNIGDNPLFLIVLIATLGALSISIGYAIYHFRDRIFIGHYATLNVKKSFRGNFKNEKFSSDRITKLLDNKKILAQLKDLSSENTLNNGKMKLTALSEDFLKIINMFEWEEDDLVEFIQEMISLTPEERKSIFNDMINKSEQRKRNRLDDATRLYT
ncbi:MAG: hypothetical protein ACFE8G_03045, partial [Candidatus Hermodarchaeota archaeon]